MANKMTKRDYFQILRETYPTDAENYAEVIAFIDHEVDLLTRKNSGEKKPTAQQKMNESIKKAIVESMEEDTSYTITDMIKTFPSCEGLATQKVSPLVNQLVKAGILTRSEDKRRAYFSLSKASEDTED